MLPNSKKFSQNTAGFDTLPNSVFSMQNVKKRISVCSGGTLHLPIFSSNDQDHTTVFLLAGKQKFCRLFRSSLFSVCTFTINHTLKKNEGLWLWNWLVWFWDFFTWKKTEIIAFFWSWNKPFPLEIAGRISYIFLLAMPCSTLFRGAPCSGATFTPVPKPCLSAFQLPR